MESSVIPYSILTSPGPAKAPIETARMLCSSRWRRGRLPGSGVLAAGSKGVKVRVDKVSTVVSIYNGSVIRVALRVLRGSRAYG